MTGLVAFRGAFARRVRGTGGGRRAVVRRRVRLVVVRGREMQRAGEERPGTMSALLGCRRDDAAALCDEVARRRRAARRERELAATGRDQRERRRRRARGVALRGAQDPRGAARRRRRVPLLVDGTGGGAAPDAIDAATFSRSAVRRRVERDGRLVDDPAELRALLVRHVVSPVRWESCAQALAAAGARSSSRPAPATSSRSSRNAWCRERGPWPWAHRRSLRRSSSHAASQRVTTYGEVVRRPAATTSPEGSVATASKTKDRLVWAVGSQVQDAPSHLRARGPSAE